MQFNLTAELAQLLNFTADVATAIRMYSAYNQSGDDRIQENAPIDVMWLSDSLHNFTMLGNAILGGNKGNIIWACDTLAQTYQGYQELHPNSSRQAKPTFDRNSVRLNLKEGIDIFNAIKAKVMDENASSK